jgi:hypothetical protein
VVEGVPIGILCRSLVERNINWIQRLVVMNPWVG